jgi:hypothetical protein
VSNAPAFIYEDSVARLPYRVKTRATGLQVTSGVTVETTLTLGGVSVIGVSARSLTYDVVAKLWSGDDEFGAWTCDIAASEVATAGTYVATITVRSSPGAVVLHTTVLRIPVGPDTGRSST